MPGWKIPEDAFLADAASLIASDSYLFTPAGGVSTFGDRWVLPLVS